MNILCFVLVLLSSMQDAPRAPDDGTTLRVRQLINDLDADYFDERTLAYEELRKIGDKAAPLLAEALGSEKERVRKAAIELLLNVKASGPLPKIADLFVNDPDRFVRAAAFKYLKEIGKVSEEHLIRGLSLPDADLLKEIIAALTNLRSGKAVDGIAEIYEQHADAGVKEMAFEYLLNIGASAGKHLVKILAKGDANVRVKCLKALEECRYAGAVEPVASICRTEESNEIRDLAFHCLVAIGRGSEESLVKMLGDAGAVVRSKSIDALLMIKGEKGTDVIARMCLKDPDEKVRAMAFMYLTSIGRAAETHLIELLKVEESSVDKEKVIEALGNGGSEKAIDPLIGLLKKPNDPLATKALTALKRIGKEGRTAVLEAAEKGRIDRFFILEVRKDERKLDLEEVFAPLITDNNMTGFYAGQFDRLKEMKDREVIVCLLMDMVRLNYEVAGGRKMAPDTMRELALIAVGEIGGEFGAGQLEAYLREKSDIDADTRRSVFIALYKLGKKDLLEQMLVDNRAWLKGNPEGAVRERLGHLFNISIVLNRVGRHDESAESYREALALVDGTNDREKLSEGEATAYRNMIYYNLACLSSLRGRKSEALEFLRKSVEAGFKDWEWMEKDGDLNTIRKEDGYRQLLKEMKGEKGE